VLLLSDERYQGLVPVIGAVDKVKFRRPVVPGDQLISEVELEWFKSSIGRIRGTATVDGEIAATIELTFKLSRRKST
jgi:3-hydroxymyristoyl/3-hydroxydecanoyl-(acyl carrier protein) dehydratase